MTSPPEDILIKCPKCGFVFMDFIRGSINLNLDNFDDEYMDKCMFATCPKCDTRINKGVFIVGKDGVFNFN